MTLRHLKIFVAVCDEMNISKAARKIHLAQPSVSLAIRELEEYYKVQLFDRVNRRIYITEQGQKLYQYASHVLQMLEELEDGMGNAEEHVKFSAGSSVTIGNYILPKLIRELKEEFPGCEVKARICNSNEIVRSVLRNELDVGLIEMRVDEPSLELIPFGKDQLLFAANNAHPLVGKKNVTLEEIQQQVLFMREEGSASREIMEGLFKSYQLKPNILMESISNQALISAIKQNTGITVLPENILREELEKGTVSVLDCHPDAFRREFYLIYHKKKYINSVADCFIRKVRALATHETE